MFSTLTALAFVVAVQAAPAPLPVPATLHATGESTFSVSAVHNSNFQRNGTAAL